MENTKAACKNQPDSWRVLMSRFEGSSQKDEIEFVCAGTQKLEDYRFGQVKQWEIKALRKKSKEEKKGNMEEE